MKREHSFMDKAIRHLELSIDLFVDNNECSAAILLAGAAEESFNKYLENNSKGSSVYNEIKENLSQSTGLDKKIVHDEANKVKNWLKHAELEKNKFLQTLTYDEEEEAVQYITRGMGAYTKVFNKTDKMFEVFFNHVKTTMPELTNKINEIMADSNR